LLQIERRAEEANTGYFDTHPAPAERVASARREAAPGVFHLSGPASLLFKDFAGLSRAVTPDFYRGVIGKGASRAALVPAASLLTGE
jgi:predicted Zn-dependent protease